MNEYFLVRDGKIINKVIASGEMAQKLTKNFDHVVLVGDAPEGTNISWLYDGTTFSAPEETPEQAARRAARRAEREARKTAEDAKLAKRAELSDVKANAKSNVNEIRESLEKLTEIVETLL